MNNRFSILFYPKKKDKNKNGRKRILTGSGFVLKKILKRRKKLSKEYGFEYEPTHGCIILSSESRIIYRYNKIMKKLMGIKNVW